VVNFMVVRVVVPETVVKEVEETEVEESEVTVVTEVAEVAEVEVTVPLTLAVTLQEGEVSHWNPK